MTWEEFQRKYPIGARNLEEDILSSSGRSLSDSEKATFQARETERFLELTYRQDDGEPFGERVGYEDDERMGERK